jgi:hypothetical protein
MVNGQWSKGNAQNFAPPRQNAGKPVIVFDCQALTLQKQEPTA